MTVVVPVKFAYAMRDLWFAPGDTGAVEGDHVICETERGTEIGLATMDPFEVPDEELGSTVGESRLRSVLRVATDEDLECAEELAAKGDDAMPTFRRLVNETGLDMKPVGVEYLFGGEKIVCYFAAEERVDFRQLVRSLSRELGGRVDMRQIGVREEAAIVGGWGHCGQELCCRRFGRGFDPVTIRMAKEQDLPLNSNKISGACGRLMCCLRYEFEAYRDFKGRAPKKNAVIDTPLGKAKIVEYDTPKEQIALRIENGKTVRVPLADMVASEAAHKKSEDLGCPCRPDTVTREALEKLQSPDVQMALAELDRKNGLVPEETFDSSDIFVSTARAKRRRARAEQGQDATGDTQEQGQKDGQQLSKSSRRRRRKKASGTQAQGQAQDAQAQQQKADDAKAEGGENRSRRRRHHKAADAAGEAGASQQTQQAKHARRPGDKGGAAAQAQQQDTQVQAQGADGEKPKKRRRRRGKRGGKGKSGEGTSTEPSGTSQSE